MRAAPAGLAELRALVASLPEGVAPAHTGPLAPHAVLGALSRSAPPACT